MITAHLIYVDPRPGVESITVTYQYPGGSIWYNYIPGVNQRLASGNIIKFSVTTYANFTLTSEEVYYSDEYDDTVNVQITPVTGESAWTFVMPSADVYIRCEAESNGSSSTPNLPGEFNRDWLYTKIAGTYTWREMIWAIIKSAGYEDYATWTLNLPTNFLGINVDASSNDTCTLAFNSAFTDGNHIGQAYHIINGVVPVGGQWIDGQYRFPQGTYTVPQYASGFRFVVNINQKTITADNFSNIWNETRTNPGTNIACIDTGSSYIVGNNKYTVTIPDSSSIAIRYIMSPENSGELVSGESPTEINDDVTSFTFKWRIKANYVLKRITAFSVGSGSSETSISNTYIYDGDTRTYTITVSNIVTGSIGVRVVIETIMINDPSNAGGTNDSAGPIGGDGDYDDTSDPVPLPSMPQISAADSGLVTLFKPTISEIRDFGNYLWSHITEFWENLQKIFTNPMDYIISLNIFPVSPVVGTPRNIYIGNWLSNISMSPLSNQFYEFDCGTIRINEHFGSFLDYAPNTTARIMLPFIGDRELAINEIMDKVLKLWYRIDMLSGLCVAILTVNDDVYYQWSGNCAVGIPVTGSDWSRMYGSLLKTGIIAGAAIAGGALGASAAAVTSTTTETPSGAYQATAAAQVGNTFNNIPKGVKGVSRERALLLDAMENVGSPTVRTTVMEGSKALSSTAVGSVIAANVMSAIPRVQHAGDMSGAITIMGNRTPYIVLEYPKVDQPKNYKHFIGYPSNQYVTLDSVNGYTKCLTVLLESTTASDGELALITEALKGGVYL